MITHSQNEKKLNISHKDSLNKEIIRKINIPPNGIITNTDGSNNPKDYGYEEVYINGKLYYYLRQNNITILYEPKN